MNILHTVFPYGILFLVSHIKLVSLSPLILDSSIVCRFFEGESGGGVATESSDHRKDARVNSMC